MRKSLPQAFSFVASNQQIACFAFTNNLWRVQLIDGSIWRTDALTDLVEKLNELLCLDTQLATLDIQILCDESAQAYIPTALSKLLELGCRQWQVLRLEPLLVDATRNSTHTINPNDEKTICVEILPLLRPSSSLEDAQQSLRQRELINHQTEIEALRATANNIAKENDALRAQNDALQFPNLEYLVTFLPLMYENFYTVVKPQDLALMAGSLQVINLPSTFTEPDANTLLMLKRKFNSLPESTQQEVLSFARKLPHKLKPRREMWGFLQEA
jgi:hypothetical protein